MASSPALRPWDLQTVSRKSLDRRRLIGVVVQMLIFEVEAHPMHTLEYLTMRCSDHNWASPLLPPLSGFSTKKEGVKFPVTFSPSLQRGSASTPVSALAKRVGCKRYPLRVRTWHLFRRSEFNFTVILRQPWFGFGWG